VRGVRDSEVESGGVGGPAFRRQIGRDQACGVNAQIGDGDAGDSRARSVVDGNAERVERLTFGVDPGDVECFRSWVPIGRFVMSGNHNRQDTDFQLRHDHARRNFVAVPVQVLQNTMSSADGERKD